MLERGEAYPPLHLVDSFQTNMKKRKNKNKRRFSDDQIMSMESIFQSDTKLEPKKKLEIAKELGLQPNQVATWFQNRRARWKSKQLERDYSILQASYDSLAEKFENLKGKQSLLIQLQKLSDHSEKPKDSVGHCKDGNSDSSDAMYEFEQKPDALFEETDPRVALGSTEGIDESFKYLDQEELDIMNVAEHTDDGVLTSPENWCSLDPKDLFDQSCGSYQWLGFLVLKEIHLMHKFLKHINVF